MTWASGLHPENRFYFDTATTFYGEWQRELDKRKPADFPDIFITNLERRFPPTVPLKFELDVSCLETMACLLNDKRHDQNIWEPMRRGQKLVRPVRQVLAQVDRQGDKKINFLFEKKFTGNSGDFANV